MNRLALLTCVLVIVAPVRVIYRDRRLVQRVEEKTGEKRAEVKVAPLVVLPLEPVALANKEGTSFKTFEGYDLQIERNVLIDSTKTDAKPDPKAIADAEAILKAAVSGTYGPKNDKQKLDFAKEALKRLTDNLVKDPKVTDQEELIEAFVDFEIKNEPPQKLRKASIGYVLKLQSGLTLVIQVRFTDDDAFIVREIKFMKTTNFAKTAATTSANNLSLWIKALTGLTYTVESLAPIVNYVTGTDRSKPDPIAAPKKR
jgi:hypothetical protein